MKEGPAQGFGPGPQLKANLRFQIEAQRGSGGATERMDPRRILKWANEDDQPPFKKFAKTFFYLSMNFPLAGIAGFWWNFLSL